MLEWLDSSTGLVFGLKFIGLVAFISIGGGVALLLLRDIVWSVCHALFVCPFEICRCFDIKPAEVHHPHLGRLSPGFCLDCGCSIMIDANTPDCCRRNAGLQRCPSCGQRVPRSEPMLSCCYSALVNLETGMVGDRRLEDIIYDPAVQRADRIHALTEELKRKIPHHPAYPPPQKALERFVERNLPRLEEMHEDQVAAGRIFGHNAASRINNLIARTKMNEVIDNAIKEFSTQSTPPPDVFDHVDALPFLVVPPNVEVPPLWNVTTTRVPSNTTSAGEPSQANEAPSSAEPDRPKKDATIHPSSICGFCSGRLMQRKLPLRVCSKCGVAWHKGCGETCPAYGCSPSTGGTFK